MPVLFTRISLLVLLFAASGISAQSILRDVKATSTGTAVQIVFTVARGASCTGYSIWHSADSLMPLVKVIDKAAEVCGYSDRDDMRIEIHTSPVQDRTNYYRVELDFPREVSGIVPVYVSATGKSGINVFPNPVSPAYPFIQLRVNGALNARLVGELYDRFGILERDIDIEAVEGRAELPVTGVEHGVYMLWLTDGTRVYAAKLIVSP